jgi:excisionase family DNA binding protein
VAVPVPPELVEAVAVRVAELLADRPPVEPDPWLDVAGAADYLACPPSRIYALVSADRVPVHRDGSRLLFRRDELDRFVEQGGAKRP